MLLLILLVFAVYKVYKWLYPVHPKEVNVYFGVPGSGKTTLAAYFTKQMNKQSRLITWALKRPENAVARWLLDSGLLKRQIPVYSNVPITGAYQLDAKKDLGVYDIHDAKVIIDEAGVEFNNRNYKNMGSNVIFWMKYHRHFGCSVDVFSQSYEDMDVTIRRLARRFWVVKKSLIPYFVVFRPIRRSVGIDDQTHQIIDHYAFGFPVIQTRRIFCPPLWKLFNSYAVPDLPPKDFPVW